MNVSEDFVCHSLRLCLVGNVDEFSRFVILFCFVLGAVSSESRHGVLWLIVSETISLPE